MSVETIFKIALHPFVRESIASLRDMTSRQGQAGAPFMDQADRFTFRGYAVCAEIRGSLEGAIVMHHHLDTAVAIGNDVAHSMLGDMHEHTEVDEELGKALAEWGNTIVGRATDFLGKHSLGFNFSAPVFTTKLDELRPYFSGVKRVITVPIQVNGIGEYHFHLLVRGGSYEALEHARMQQPQSELSSLAEAKDKPGAIAVANTGERPLPFESQILLVDDSVLIRRAIRGFLNELGYGDIIEAQDGVEAVELVDEGGIDFVIMDVVMTHMNGDEALSLIRDSSPSLPVVMLSSVTDEMVVDEFVKKGISGFIFKPLNQETGPGILRECLKV